eukprot:evm.model.scf_238EXC.6 EVM.evm.TU.scf_238EXC.6   scf_238EXC:54616-55491(+)
MEGWRLSLALATVVAACLASARAQDTCQATYTVTPGDTSLYDIGAKLGVDYNLIHKANVIQIADPNKVYQGQVFNIPPCTGPLRDPVYPEFPWLVPQSPSPYYIAQPPHSGGTPVPTPTTPAPLPPPPAPTGGGSTGNCEFNPNLPFKPPQVLDGNGEPTYIGPEDTSLGYTCETAPYVGDATYYHQNGGYTACGNNDLNDQDMIAAISWQIYDRTDDGGNPNASKSCQRCAKVYGPLDPIIVRIKDKCGGCKPGDIDLSPRAFNILMGGPEVGRQPGVKWHYVDCAEGGF